MSENTVEQSSPLGREESPPRDESARKTNLIGQVVFNDIAKTTHNNKGQITEKNIGSVLGQIRKDVKQGVSLKEQGIKVFSSLTAAMTPQLSDAIQQAVVYHNKPVEREERITNPSYPPIKSQNFKDEVLGKVFWGDAYEAILEHQKLLYASRADVKLVRYNGTLVTITEHRAGERLRIVQVLDCDFPETEEYKRYLERQRREGYVESFLRPEKEQWVPVHHLFVEDTTTGKTIDLRSFLPEEWLLRYYPTQHLHFSQESTEKVLTYSELSSPEFLVAFLHEYGHCLQDVNYPEFFEEVNALWRKSRFTPGGPMSLDPEIFNKTKALLVRNERGASARAVQVVRILSENGLDLGIPIARIGKFVNDALASYERVWKGGKTKFLRLDPYNTTGFIFKK